LIVSIGIEKKASGTPGIHDEVTATDKRSINLRTAAFEGLNRHLDAPARSDKGEGLIRRSHVY
jgi:hypothetical protein